MQDQSLCQSCAMPLTEDILGTNADGSKNREYCSYCYKDGKFTSDMTMEQMIGFCAPMMAESMPELTQDKAKEQMRAFFPQLKRWAVSN